MAEFRPDNASEVESFDLVVQRGTAQGLGCGGLHPNHIKMRSDYDQQ